MVGLAVAVVLVVAVGAVVAVVWVAVVGAAVVVLVTVVVTRVLAAVTAVVAVGTCVVTGTVEEGLSPGDEQAHKDSDSTSEQTIHNGFFIKFSPDIDLHLYKCKCSITRSYNIVKDFVPE